jgi:heme exporter protein D
VQSGKVQWSRALPGAALGGVFSLLAMVIPFGVFGPAFMLGGGLAVMLYRRASGGVAPTTGGGARIGAASGGFGFLYLTVLAIAMAVYRSVEMRDAMLESVSQMTARGYDPQKVAQVEQLLKTSDGMMLFLAFGLFMMLLIMVAGSSIGGAFYAAWSRRRSRS